LPSCLHFPFATPLLADILPACAFDFLRVNGRFLMKVALQLASVVVSILLVVLIMLQVKGGALDSFLGGEAGGGIARTRRGLERTLFHITIFLSIAFFGISLLSVVVNS